METGLACFVGSLMEESDADDPFNPFGLAYAELPFCPLAMSRPLGHVRHRERWQYSHALIQQPRYPTASNKRTGAAAARHQGAYLIVWFVEPIVYLA